MREARHRTLNVSHALSNVQKLVRSHESRCSICWSAKSDDKRCEQGQWLYAQLRDAQYFVHKAEHIKDPTCYLCGKPITKDEKRAYLDPLPGMSGIDICHWVCPSRGAI